MATVGFLPKKNDKNINERLWGWQTLLSWEPALQKKANYDMRKARRTIEKVGSQLVDQLSTNVRQWNYLPPADLWEQGLKSREISEHPRVIQGGRIEFTRGPRILEDLPHYS